MMLLMEGVGGEWAWAACALRATQGILTNITYASFIKPKAKEVGDLYRKTTDCGQVQKCPVPLGVQNS